MSDIIVSKTDLLTEYSSILRWETTAAIFVGSGMEAFFKPSSLSTSSLTDSVDVTGAEGHDGVCPHGTGASHSLVRRLLHPRQMRRPHEARKGM
jgi:hypothetical protein